MNIYNLDFCKTFSQFFNKTSVKEKLLTCQFDIHVHTINEFYTQTTRKFYCYLQPLAGTITDKAAICYFWRVRVGTHETVGAESHLRRRCCPYSRNNMGIHFKMCGFTTRKHLNISYVDKLENLPFLTNT